MHFDERMLASQQFEMSAALPENYTGYRLPAGRVFSATLAGTGTIVQQELVERNYTIRFNYFDVCQPFRLKIAQQGGRLISFLSTGNTIDYDITGAGNLKLKQGQFAMLHSAACTGTLHFFKARPYACIEVVWSEQWLRSLIAQFIVLQKLFAPARGRKHAFFLQPKPRPAGIRALDMATTILRNPYDPAISGLFLEHHVYEYLLLLLLESSKKPVPLQPLTERERETLIRIGEMVRQGFDRQFPIAELSRHAGMNTTKLKTGFREIHGHPISRVHMTARMEEARRLLAETDYSTKQVSELVGYKYATSFIQNFQKHFGYSPSQVQ
jgi:AraC-like DNA-binding protein